MALKSRSLLQDNLVIAIPEMVLDVNARWLPEDIRGFIPWVRHDDLESSRARELVRAWAEKEVEKINESLQGTMDGINDVNEIVKLRGGLLALWRGGSQVRRKFLPDGSSGENFRSIILARLVAVMKNMADELSGVGTKIISLLDSAEAETEGISLPKTLNYKH